MTMSRCPGCPDGRKHPGKYLCRTCWFALSDATRRRLNQRDSRAYVRLRELHRQLSQGVALAEIRITA